MFRDTAVIEKQIKLTDCCGFLRIVAFFLCRIASLLKPRVIALSVLFTRAIFICTVTAAVSDGSSPSMAPSAAVRCLLMRCCG